MGKRSKQVVVIGGGIGGMAAAIRLAAAGCKVTLVEKNERLGGKVNLFKALHPQRPHDRPFRFDTGPNLLTLPLVFEQLFAVAGETMADHLTLRPLDPIARFLWPDGTSFELRSGESDRDREVERIAPDDLQGWRRFLRESHQFSERTDTCESTGRPASSLNEGWAARVRESFRSLAARLHLGSVSSYARLVNRHIRNQKLREVLYHYATCSGVNPAQAPENVAATPGAEMRFGGWYIDGGMYRLVVALETIARKLGVEIRLGCPVQRILIEGKIRRATGVRLADGSGIRADAVVANSDAIYTYRRLIPAQYRPECPDSVLDRFKPESSAMVLLLGIEGHYPQLAQHSRFMPADANDLKSALEMRTLPSNPCISVCSSTRTDPSQAPDGCENLSVIAPAPALNGRLNWLHEGPRYRDQLVRALEERWGLQNFSSRIVVERQITPLDLQSIYNAAGCNRYSIAPSNPKGVSCLPPNRATELKGLYFVGACSVPGGGLPVAAESGKTVSEQVMADA